MAKYVWNASVFNGAPLYAATIATTVYVYNAAVDPPALVQIWNDIDGTDSKANPFTITAPGKIRFYANEGRYNIVVQNGSDSDTWEDELIGPTGSGGGGGTVDSVVAGTGIAVDSTDPANPVVSSTGGNAEVIGITGESTTRISSYTLAPSDHNLFVETSGNMTVTLPAASAVVLQLPDNEMFLHHIRHNGGGNLTISPGAGATAVAPAGGSLVLSGVGQTVTIALSTVTPDKFIVIGQTNAAV